jgi:C-terminal processing protease CtpA/Prc
MKIKSLITIALIWLCFGAKAQMPDSVKLVLDSSISLLKQYSFNKKNINWNKVKQTAYKKAAGAKTWNDLAPVASYLFEAVNDHHGWLSVGDTNFNWNKKHDFKFSKEIKNEIAKGNRIVKKILPGNIGYLRVPGMMLDTSLYNKTAQRLADSLCALNAEGATKFIIDLRLNAGGTMYPMIAGVSALLGNGKFIGSANSENIIENMCILEDGKFYSTQGGAAAVKNNCNQVSNSTPVVVLTSNLTGSAGECAAVTFKGRPHTIFIGEPTAGFTSENDGHWIIEGKAGIVIAESMLADRNGKIYSINIQPDELVWGGDNFDDYLKDSKIKKAIEWLAKD